MSLLKKYRSLQFKLVRWFWANVQAPIVEHWNVPMANTFKDKKLLAFVEETFKHWPTWFNPIQRCKYSFRVTKELGLEANEAYARQAKRFEEMCKVIEEAQAYSTRIVKEYDEYLRQGKATH